MRPTFFDWLLLAVCAALVFLVFYLDARLGVLELLVK